MIFIYLFEPWTGYYFMQMDTEDKSIMPIF